VTESYEVIRANPWPIRKLTMRKRHDGDSERPQKLLANMETSLTNLEGYLHAVSADERG
jgi:phage-related protein